jgi:uncharacterized protein with NAD-binding domain and iron-sulfur cluster
MPKEKKKIAIFGGGIGALSAAFDLTENDPNKSYDITIYTLGWRLGGKAAVGRDVEGKAFEHGVHLWAGFYDHAFDLIKRLYHALGYPDDDWRRPFERLNHVTLMEFINGKWLPWAFSFRANLREPGIDRIGSAPLDLIKLMLELLAWGESEFGLHQFRDIEGLLDKVSAIFPVRIPPIAAAAAHAGSRSDAAQSVSIVQSPTILSLLELAHESVAEKGALSKLDHRTRRAWILIDLGLAFVRGIIEDDDILVKGFDSIDDEEWSDWLRRYGCQQESLDSAPMRACYDYVFGYAKNKIVDGRTGAYARNVGAGTGAHALLRFLLSYKGSIFYRLRKPMGDFLFVPLYKLLKKRHVKFKFFHRLDELKLSADGKSISEIVDSRQVELTDSGEEYDPLLRPDRESWPNRPDFEQIKDSDPLKSAHLEGRDLESAWAGLKDVAPLTLKLSSSLLPGDEHDPNLDTFDLVILGVGLGALRPICKNLITHLPAWRGLLDNVETTSTLAVQLWTAASTGGLGWPDPQTILTAFHKPDQDLSIPFLTTWEDNSDLLALEQPGIGAKSLSYFVGQFPDAPAPPPPRGYNPEFLKSERLRAERAADEFLARQRQTLWPAFDGKSIRHRHVQPNINPSDRYVLSVKGSSKFRLAADGSGIGNLFLAGDWVRTSLNAGCIEAAIMAGCQAARAITGVPMAGLADNSGVRLLPHPLLPVANIIGKLRQSVTAGVGSMDAYCVITEEHRETVEGKLPSELTIGTPSGSTAKLINMFARQRNVRPGIAPFGGMNYREFIQIIPNVIRSRADGTSDGPFAYMSCGLLDQLAPVAIGVNLYGFNKRRAHLSGQDGSFDIRSNLGEISIIANAAGLPRGMDKIDNLRAVKPLMELPLIANAVSGSWIYSYLDFCLDTATFQPVTGKALATGGLVPSWASEQDFQSIADKEFGAFRLTSKWHLSLPLSSGDLTTGFSASGLRIVTSGLRVLDSFNPSWMR